MKTLLFLTFFSRICLAFSLLAPSTASAQAYRSQLHFLEEFAIRQYDRGNMADASKEFQRILNLQPDNAIAREYLQKIAQQPRTPTAVKADINAVISDISQIRDQLNDYEKDAKDLAYMIRNLITENDALYQSLYKRSREVIEMREKLHGTPYGELYAAAMKDIPVDRVPQRLHPANDILAETAPAPTPAPTHAPGSFANAIDTQEVNALIADIHAMAQQKKSPNLSAISSPDKLEQLRQALESKRDILMDTAVTTIEKNQNLEKVKTELAGVNTSIRQSSDRYMEAIKKIDNYYGTIKANLARKTVNDQKMFSELVADYADRVKEIEELKSALQHHDKNLSSFKTALTQNDTKLITLRQAMDIRDAQLSNLKSLLVQYKKALSERDAVIHLQQDDLNLTDKKLAEISDSLSGIEKNLADNTTAATAATVAAVASTVAYNDIHVKEVDKQNASLSASLILHEKAIGTAGKRIQQLEQQLSSVTADLNKVTTSQESLIRKPLLAENAALQASLAEKDAQINLLQKTINNIPDELAQSRQQQARFSESLAETTAAKNAAEQQLSTASEKILRLERSAAIKDQRLAELSDAVARLQVDQRSLRPVTSLRATDDDARRALEMRLRRCQDLVTEAETAATRAHTTAAELKDQLAMRDIQIAQLKELSSVNQTEELKALKRQLSEQESTSGATAALTLNLKEQEAKIATLQETLATQEKTLQETQNQLAAKNELLSHENIKQQAAIQIVDARDQEIARLNTTLDALKQELLSERRTRQELAVQQNEAAAARDLAENKLQQQENEIASWQSKANDLRRDIKTAADLLDKKGRAHDATLAEVKRLNDILEKKNNEIADLQSRVRQ